MERRESSNLDKHFDPDSIKLFSPQPMDVTLADQGPCPPDKPGPASLPHQEPAPTDDPTETLQADPGCELHPQTEDDTPRDKAMTGNYESNIPLYSQADNNNEEDEVSWANELTEQDRSDVTLVCEEDQQIEAHKVILTAGSPHPINVLEETKHPHPMIYMRETKAKDLKAVLDPTYHGEANINQEDINGLLALAKKLHLKRYFPFSPLHPVANMFVNLTPQETIIKQAKEADAEMENEEREEQRLAHKGLKETLDFKAAAEEITDDMVEQVPIHCQEDNLIGAQVSGNYTSSYMSTEMEEYEESFREYKPATETDISWLDEEDIGEEIDVAEIVDIPQPKKNLTWRILAKRMRKLIKLQKLETNIIVKIVAKSTVHLVIYNDMDNMNI